MTIQRDRKHPGQLLHSHVFRSLLKPMKFSAAPMSIQDQSCILLGTSVPSSVIPISLCHLLLYRLPFHETKINGVLMIKMSTQKSAESFWFTNTTRAGFGTHKYCSLVSVKRISKKQPMLTRIYTCLVYHAFGWTDRHHTKPLIIHKVHIQFTVRPLHTLFIHLSLYTQCRIPLIHLTCATVQYTEFTYHIIRILYLYTASLHTMHLKPIAPVYHVSFLYYIIIIHINLVCMYSHWESHQHTVWKKTIVMDWCQTISFTYFIGEVAELS